MLANPIVSAQQLASEIDDPDCIVIDCRFALGDPAEGRRQYDSAHLPGAQYAHLDDDLSSPITPASGRHPLPDAGELRKKLGGWGVGATSRVVAYDDSGGAFAARLWWLLNWLGHQDTRVLNGGYSAWVAAALPTTSDTPATLPRDFTGEQDDSLWISTSALMAQLAQESMTLIDAREPERYRGESEPIDPVAGHVPGAVNLPFKANVDDSGALLPGEQLAERFTPLNSSGKPVAHMCGSGVTACHNMLAMCAAGLNPGRLYAGSWSEWIRDPSRPVDKEG